MNSCFIRPAWPNGNLSIRARASSSEVTFKRKTGPVCVWRIHHWSWPPVTDHVLGDCRLRQLESKLPEFSVDARRSPVRICQAHLSNQIDNFARHGRSAQPMMALPSPVEPSGSRENANRSLSFRRSTFKVVHLSRAIPSFRIRA